MKEQCLLDLNIIFLNHDSFRACPHPVFEKYQEWQRRLELLIRQAGVLLAEARAVLADYIGCDADEAVYTSNPTTAVNFVTHSLDLQPRDEILATDHEYGAMDRTWHFI